MSLPLPDALKAHATLQELATRVADERIYYRAPAKADERFRTLGEATCPAIDRDRTICGLTNKAARTHAAIRLLVDAELMSDARALCRVLMENVFTISWILQDSGLRLDVYVLADELFRRRLAEVTLIHYQHDARMCADARDRLCDQRSRTLADALEGSWRAWPRRERGGRLEQIGARGMFSELGIVGPQGERISFLYDVVYFQQSHDVHSTIFSLREFPLDASEAYRLDLKPSQSKAAETVNAANIFMIQALSDFANFTGAECFQPELDQVWEEMKGQVPRLNEPATRER